MGLSIENNNNISHYAGLLFIMMALHNILYLKEDILISYIVTLGVRILCIPVNYWLFITPRFLLILFLLIACLVNVLITENGLGGTLNLLGNLLFVFLCFEGDKKKTTLWVLSPKFLNDILGKNITIDPENGVY